jgi:hypothetical protein
MNVKPSQQTQSARFPNPLPVADVFALILRSRQAVALVSFKFAT